MGHAELSAATPPDAHRHHASSWTSDAVAQLAARFDVCYDKALVDRPDDLARALADADALIVRNRTRSTRRCSRARRRLRVVGRLGVGLDNIDVDACAARGIEVIPATGANALAVAEYVIATAMLLLRGAYAATRRRRRRRLAARARCRTAARWRARRSASSASAASDA